MIYTSVQLYMSDSTCIVIIIIIIIIIIFILIRSFPYPAISG